MTTYLKVQNDSLVAPANFNCASVPAAAARQGDYIDFGAQRTANWLARIKCIGFAATPTANGSLDLYMSWSSVPASSGFAGNVTGSDAPYTGYSTVADGLPQLDPIGSLVTSVSGLQSEDVGIAFPKLRYGAPVLVNSTSVALASISGVIALTFTSIDDVTP